MHGTSSPPSRRVLKDLEFKSKKVVGFAFETEPTTQVDTSRPDWEDQNLNLVLVASYADELAKDESLAAEWREFFASVTRVCDLMREVE